jgi:hypothetical protein
MFWARFLPENSSGLDAAAGPAPKVSRLPRPKEDHREPSPEQVALDLRLAALEAEQQQRRERIERRGLYLKALAWTLAYAAGVAILWVVIRLMG